MNNPHLLLLQKEISLNKTMNEELNVIKRDGSIETVSFDKILNRIRKIGNEVSLKINYTTLAMKVIEQLYDNIHTTKIDELSAEQCASMASIHPDYSVLAGRIVVSNHHKNTSASFSQVMRQLYKYVDKHGIHSPLVSQELMNVVNWNEQQLNDLCNYDRDYLIDYFGFKTLERAYLMRINGVVVERPQHMWLRVAIGIHGADMASVIETYNYMSQKYFTHATPTLFNSGTPHSQLSSCYLMSMEDDSIEGIFNTLKDCALISKWAGGIGLHIHNIRSSGSHIRGTNGASNGIVPMLRVFNNTAKYVDQCVIGTTQVYGEKGFMNIEDVVAGETLVYTFPILDGADFSHEEFNRMNNLKETGVENAYVSFDPVHKPGLRMVNKVIKHDYSGDMLTVNTTDEKAYKTLKITPMHPVLCVRSENYDAYMASLMSMEPVYWKWAEWVEASKLRRGDYLLRSLILADKVTSITQGYYTGFVYDLEVNEVPNYLTDCGIVHNGGGKRNGSFAIYLEPWHADIELFLNMRKNHGDEELRARDLFYALWIPDLFMERVKTNGTWTLMCPDECIGLADVYGDEFVKLYTKYESEGKGRKTVQARDLWFQILDAQMETGTPYLCYKDASNKKSNQQNLGTIKSSNLCVAGETLVLTDRGQIAIRELAGKEVNVWNGEEWSRVTVFKTGKDVPVITVTIKPSPNNSQLLSLRCTKQHKFYVYNEHGVALPVDAENLRLGMEVIDLNTPFRQLGYSGAVVVGINNYWENCDTFCFTEPKRHMGVFNGILTGQCTEIVEYSDEKETAVCNLASIALPMFVDTQTRTFDYDKLHMITKVVCANLNKIIDVNYYPTEKTRRSNFRHRPIGLGVQGLADTFILLDIPFYSEEAKKINKMIFETIYHGAVEKSCEIARDRYLDYMEKGIPHDYNEYDTEYIQYLETYEDREEKMKLCGAYSSFIGSPAQKGILQFDLWEVAPDSGRYDWDRLKSLVQTYGLRNSLLVAPMPTASTSQILGFNECIEPITSNIYSRKTLAGEFILANKYLMHDLIALGLWNDKMKNAIISGNGSIQHIADIPVEIKNKYKTVWEIPMKHLIDMASDRGAYICQSQSLNLWLEDPNYNMLTSMHFYSWSKGLKTGIYYLRRRAKHQAQKFTIEPEKAKHGGGGSSANASDELEGCLTCSA